MPGVLQIEAMAQLGGFVALQVCVCVCVCVCECVCENVCVCVYV